MHKQRNPTFGTSQEFLSSSPDRSFPMLVQFGHSSVAETREQSSDGGRQFRGVAVGCAAIAGIGQRQLSGCPIHFQSEAVRGSQQSALHCRPRF